MLKREFIEESGERVLVVDDETYICKLCFDILSNCGYRVTTTTNPQHAFQQVSQDSFNLVVTDIVMPDINGLELVKKLKCVSPDLPVVIMTGYATLETAVEAVKEGASYFVRKPFNIDELKLAVRNGLERKKLLSENIRLQTLVNLFEVSEEISSLHDPSKIYTLLLKSSVKETRAQRAGIFQLDPETKQVYLRYDLNLDVLSDKITHFDTSHGLPGQVFKRKDALTVDNWVHGWTDFRSIGEENWCSHAIGVPLKSNGEVTDVLCLYKSESRFTEADLDSALILASQASGALRNADLVLELEILFLETMKSLAKTLDARDPYTHGHSKRVAQIALAIGKQLGLSENELDELELAGNLHDIGKIGIRDSILLKAGRLTPEEYEIIKTHPEKGFDILKHIKRLSPVVEAVYSHHEWHNGCGYPRGLKTDEIPLAGAIIAAADAFDTIVTDRLYRKRRNYEAALGILQENAGTQFNPEVVRALCAVDKKDLPL
ncbi:MAG: HD domain-containing phosphohydrolase [bacterium]